MRRIRRMVFGVPASTSLLAGVGGAAPVAVTTITPNTILRMRRMETSRFSG